MWYGLNFKGDLLDSQPEEYAEEAYEEESFTEVQPDATAKKRNP